MNRPKGIDPKVWGLAEGALDTMLANHGYDGWRRDSIETIALAISKAIEAERASWEPAVVYFDRYCQDEADDVEYCISAEHHKDAIAFQAIRNLKHKTEV